MLSTIESLQSALEHQQAGRWQDAERIYGEVLAREPTNADALHLLGVLASQTGQHQAAATCIARAIALNPAAPFYHNNLGNVLQEMGRLADSLLCYEEALRLEPDYVEARVNLGNALSKLGRFSEALRCYLDAQRLRPDDPNVYVNLGHALKDRGMIEDGLGCFEEALRLDPENAAAHSARAVVWLLKGDFERGWREYEWRWKAPAFPPRPFTQPMWDGAPLEGRTILLHAEQGLGDTIQFIRYAPLVKRAGGTVVVECQPRLAPLIERVGGVDRVIAAGSPLPAFDVHAPLLSLPRIFGTTLETVPIGGLRSLSPNCGRGRRVGLVWAGSRAHRADDNRSLSLADFAPLARVPGVRFVSLQRGPRAEQALSPPAGMALECEPEGDILSTAAVIQGLDLVISTDTMAPHLAGALGRPVWLLLPFVPEWRWLLDRDDSPWYPTMRLFRQPGPGAWAAVIERVARELESFQ